MRCVGQHGSQTQPSPETGSGSEVRSLASRHFRVVGVFNIVMNSQDWMQMQTNLQSRHNSVRGMCLKCGAEVSLVYPVQPTRKPTPGLQTKAAPKGSASVATKDESATQAPVEYVYTDELFDNYPPPADMEIDEDDFAELRSELLGQKMGGKLPNTEMLKRYNCVEQYLLCNSYVSYW